MPEASKKCYIYAVCGVLQTPNCKYYWEEEALKQFLKKKILFREDTYVMGIDNEIYSLIEKGFTIGKFVED